MYVYHHTHVYIYIYILWTYKWIQIWMLNVSLSMRVIVPAKCLRCLPNKCPRPPTNTLIILDTCIFTIMYIWPYTVLFFDALRKTTRFQHRTGAVSDDRITSSSKGSSQSLHALGSADASPPAGAADVCLKSFKKYDRLVSCCTNL